MLLLNLCVNICLRDAPDRDTVGDCGNTEQTNEILQYRSHWGPAMGNNARKEPKQNDEGSQDNELTGRLEDHQSESEDARNAKTAQSNLKIYQNSLWLLKVKQNCNQKSCFHNNAAHCAPKNEDL